LNYDKEDLPMLSIIMAAHNEELILRKKLDSIFSSEYPKNKLELLIGTDCCNDSTDDIIVSYKVEHPEIQHVIFKERSGKVRIVNQLVQKANNEILLLTDANVLFSKNTLFELAKHFKNKQIGLVDSHMKHYGLSETGISFPEQSYISLEVQLKDAEGKQFGSMMGPFGGCFAMRKNLFSAVPSNYLVDDFHISMNVLRQKAQCIHEHKAIVFEDVSNHLNAEFKRKVRISTGNFQNLAHFKSMLLRADKVTFVFISHKVLRWLSPFFLSAALISAYCFRAHSSLNLFILTGFCIVIFLVLLDLLLMKMKFHLRLLRYLTHFTSMNLALLIGFFKYLKGNSDGIWHRTERLQNGSPQ
jgi:cellulose synthase/poly-beta-1,6-N-acetylglucosamine synthase-like glycosyltransferase